ncbi:hypothetical protein KP79_PYT17068 [Mizuhopecten yessoensis]|uniref:Uncharacterized protein n=1 Tax=Mizuhopecten yessoensis TaxID=6573 RepID=A0A210R2F2_MIZYE|nr:hypothetical protein KP79_PYT17068 [Mizuhopecten yessoensis]
MDAIAFINRKPSSQGTYDSTPTGKYTLQMNDGKLSIQGIVVKFGVINYVYPYDLEYLVSLVYNINVKPAVKCNRIPGVRIFNATSNQEVNMNTNESGDEVVVNHEIKDIYTPGRTKEEVRDSYNSWADTYESVGLRATSGGYVRKCGYIILSMREEYLRDPEYDGVLEVLIESMEKKGKWIIIKKSVIPNYYVEKEGIVFVFKKT